METKKQGHTPGPWLAGVDQQPQRGQGFNTDDVYSADGLAVCKMTGDVAHSYHDARLIAAAPDLLQACKRAYRDINARLGLCGTTREEDEAFWDLADALEAAIAKAKG